MCHCPNSEKLNTYPKETNAGAAKQWTIQANEADMPITSDFTGDIDLINCNTIANIIIFPLFKKFR